MADCVVRRDRGAEGDRDDDRTVNVETFDQLLEVAGLVDQRKPVIGPSRLRVSAAVVGEAAMIGGEFRELVFPIFEPVDFTVNEDQVAALAFHLIMEVAAICLDQGHALLTCRTG